MTLTAIIGGLGEGKTLALTYLAYRSQTYKNVKIYSNYHLESPLRYESIHSFEDIENMKDGDFFGDELWSWLDSRESISDRNKIISSILLKSRKRGIDIFFTTQSFGQIDVRIRRITDFIAQPELRRFVKYEKESIPTLCILKIFDFNFPVMSTRAIRIFKFHTLPVFDLYDTREEVKKLD